MELEAIALGDRLLAPSFVKAVRYHFIFEHVSGMQRNLPPPSSTVIMALNRLDPDDSIFQLLADMHVIKYGINKGWRDSESQQLEYKLPVAFLLLIMRKYGQRGGSKGYQSLWECTYHGHTTPEERKACEAEKKR